MVQNLLMFFKIIIFRSSVCERADGGYTNVTKQIKDEKNAYGKTLITHKSLRMNKKKDH